MKYDPRGVMTIQLGITTNLASLPRAMSPEQIAAFMAGMAKLIAVDCQPAPSQPARAEEP